MSLPVCVLGGVIDMGRRGTVLPFLSPAGETRPEQRAVPNFRSPSPLLRVNLHRPS